MRISVQSILCCLCQEHEESIQHLLSGCPVLASTSYLHRHNMVARVHLSKCFKVPLSAKYWYDHQPLLVVENSSVKILWDFSLQTDIHVSSNRPDIVLVLKQEHRIMFFEVFCPADINVPAKEQEKFTKYQPLVREFSECHVSLLTSYPLFFVIRVWCQLTSKFTWSKTLITIRACLITSRKLQFWGPSTSWLHWTLAILRLRLVLPLHFCTSCMCIPIHWMK